MFKVVIIDDEPLILRNIKNSIESLDDSFQVVGTANEGMTGLNIIHEKNPDIVFVDISMPVLTGLELIRILRNEGNLVPIVILSGYQEFEYAKQAIQLDVLDYLVKPMNPLALKKFLEQLKEKLSLNRYEQRKQFFEGTVHYRIMNDVKSGLFEEEEQFIFTKICIGPYNFFRNNQFAQIDSTYNMIVIKEICERKWGKSEQWIIDGKYENELLLIRQYTKDKSYGSIDEVYVEVQKEMNQKNYVTFVGSNKPVNVLELREELTRLESELYHNSVFGSSKNLTTTSEGNRNLNMLENIDYEQITMLVTKKKKEEFLMAVKDILSKCQNMNCTQANLIQTIKKIMKICCPSEAVDEMDFIVNLVVINSLNYENLYNKLCESVLEYSDLEECPNVDEVGAEYMVYKIQEYLDSHYQEKVLIQNVADKFGFNYSYLCHLFRKHRQVSPNEYIIMKRIELSKKLLRIQADLNIREIAVMVGYSDQYYFSRIFKSYTGVSPTDFRNNVVVENEKNGLHV